jgi:DNA primase
VKAYKLLPKEKDMEYYKDFALMIIYVTKEDSAKVAEMSARIIDNANTPEYLAALVNRLNAKE